MYQPHPPGYLGDYSSTNERQKQKKKEKKIVLQMNAHIGIDAPTRNDLERQK